MFIRWSFQGKEKIQAGETVRGRDQLAAYHHAGQHLYSAVQHAVHQVVQLFCSTIFNPN